MTTRAAHDARELLGMVELTDVIVWEVAGRRAEDAERAGDVEPNLNVQARGGDTWIEVRCRLSTATKEADFVADFAARYTSDEPFEVESDALREFVEKVGVMALYPFLRESVQTTASRLGVPRPVLGLLRAGEFTVGSPEEPEDGSEVGPI